MRAICGRGMWTRWSMSVSDAGLLSLQEKDTYPGSVLWKLVACLFDWRGFVGGVG